MKLELNVSFPSNPGCSVVPVYSPRLEKSGAVVIVQTSERDLQSEIQSHADSVNIENIMQRYAMGDLSVLSRTQGFYGDFMSVPKTYAEVLQTLIDGRNFFDALPVEIRNEFGNDFNRFYSDIGSADWFKTLGKFAPQTKDPAPEQSAADGSAKAD